MLFVPGEPLLRSPAPQRHLKGHAVYTHCVGFDRFIRTCSIAVYCGEELGRGTCNFVMDFFLIER